MCVSVLLGARILARADDTVAVLAAQAPLAAGQQVRSEDVVSVRLRFTSAADAERYLPADTPLPEGQVVTRPVGAGELVPRGALSAATGEELVELPLGVPPAGIPGSVGAGSLVDVWVTAGQDGERAGDAQRVLARVPVLAAGRSTAGGLGGVRQVVVGVPAAEQDRLPRVVSSLADGSVLLVRRPD